MNLQELKNTLSTSFDLDVWKNILLNILGDKIEYFTSSQKIVGENILCGGHIGSVRLDDGKTLGIIDIEVDDHIIIKRNRKALRGMVKDYIDQQKIHALLVFFHNRNQDDYRVSYIVKQTYFTPEGEFIKHESEPKRYTFLLGKNESCTTAALRLFDLIKKRREGSLYMLDLTEAFSVEKLNKEFFDKYVKHYRNFCEDIINNDNCRAKEFGIAEKQDFKHDDNKPIRDYVKKMMGRLVFLYFLQKRGWMNGDYSYLHNLYKSKTEFHNDYLEQILEPLFFCVLNTKEDKRIPEKIANLGDVSGIPYLNGGLFEKDRLDYKEVVFKKSLFDDLFEFFSQYNFTIDENDPYDAEVGIDPEMLGHIFENLLEDNKDKGAFYTPKEIVQYMCKQSLVEYLKSKTKSKEWDLYIAKLIDKHILDESVQNNVDFISTISGLLTNVKICDPAIGSGAFPMGMLNELFHCRQILHGFTRNAKAFAPATIKREIIQDNIYGVDIEQGAVDIARLRFWLSLIVDADKASPLPNFDYKIVCGNSLITTFNGNPIDLKTRTKGVNANKIRDKKKQLYDLQSKFYNLSGNEKLEREVEIKQCLIEIIELQLDFKFEVVKDSNIQMQYLFEEYNTKAKKANAPSYINSQMAELQRIKSSLFGISPIEERAKIEIPLFDWKIIFSDVFKNDDKVNDKDGFDIVIGNPPYLKEGRASKAIFEIVKDSPYYQGKMDLWYMFACYGVDLLSKDGILSFIATNNWVTNSGASKMRDKIISDTRILQLADFGKYMIFESASIQTMVMLFQKNKSADDYCVDYRRIIGDAKLADVVSLLEKKESNNVEYLTPSLKRDKFKGRYITFSAKEKLLDTMSSNNNVIFLTAKEATNGIHPHYDFINNKTALLGDFNVGEGIFGLSKTELNQLNLSLEEQVFIKPYYESASLLYLYFVNPNNENWIIYTHSGFKNPNSMDIYPNLKAHLDKFKNVITSDNKPYGLHRAREERFFKGEKVVALRKCVGRPQFSYSDFDSYLSATFYVIKTDRVNLKYLTGLLNSKLVAFWLKNRGKMQGDNYQLDKEPLMQIPIAVPSKQVQETISILVDYMCFLKNPDQVNISENLVSNNFVANYFEEIIDGCVYELYFEEHMKEQGLNILDTVEQMIKPIYQISDTKTKGDVIWEVFNSIKKTDNLIRTRLGLYATTSEILAAIITTK